MDRAPLPCPFCGTPDPELLEADGDAWARVCRGCGAIGPLVANEDEATRRWNERRFAAAPDAST